MKNIAVFASGRGSNAEKIIEYFTGSDIAAVSIVVTDNPSAGVLGIAAAAGIEYAVVPRKASEASEPITNILNSRSIDFIVLAGYLSLIPDTVIDSHRGRIINIHPALLPAYGGKGMYGDNVHRAVIAAGEKISGITIHHVNERYDQGEVIAQFTTDVTPEDDPGTLAQKIHQLEHRHFPRVIEEQIKNILKNEYMRLLLISNSTNAGEEYLKYPLGNISEFLGDIKEVLFVPYAAVSFSYDQYLERVRNRFDEIGVRVRSVHQYEDPAREVRRAEAVVVGGGNTFALVKAMQETGVMDAVRERALEGVPYIGWSAGSNVACPTLCTTNDMPIVQPASFKTMGLVKFQINPHYLDHNPEGHAGETRQQRIDEYTAANPGMYVAGLREGCMLKFENDHLELIGPKPLRVFRSGREPMEIRPGENLSFLK